MYFSSSSPSSAFNPPIPAAVKTLSPSSESRLCTISTARSRRRMNIKASLSSVVLESITFNSAGRSSSLYEILRIDQTASQMEIKTAYRSLAKLYHPDAAAVQHHDDDDSETGDREFIEIHDAYETLSDPASRAMYDLSLDAASNYYRRRRSVGFSGGYYTTQRWETDQCW